MNNPIKEEIKKILNKKLSISKLLFDIKKEDLAITWETDEAVDQLVELVERKKTCFGGGLKMITKLDEAYKQGKADTRKQHLSGLTELEESLCEVEVWNKGTNHEQRLVLKKPILAKLQEIKGKYEGIND